MGKTSVTLPVKQRIAEGLSYAGTSNTLKVVSYNFILGIIAIAGSGAVRQFCIFAIVVLVAHWFLAHTFFMTVLSIDIQRLEVSICSSLWTLDKYHAFQLEELLRRDTALAPSLLRQDSGNMKQTRSGWAKLGHALKRLLKGRAGTNVSLVLVRAHNLFDRSRLISFVAPCNNCDSLLYDLLDQSKRTTGEASNTYASRISETN